MRLGRSGVAIVFTLRAVFAGGAALILATLTSSLIALGLARLELGAVAIDQLKARAEQIADPATPLGLALALAPSGLAFVAAAFSFAAIEPVAPKVLLRLRAPRVSDLLWTTTGMAGLSLALGAMVSLLGLGEGGTLGALRSTLDHLSPLGRFAMLPATAILPALGEELFFRGMVFGAGERLLGRRFGLLLSALLFGVAHVDPVQGPLAALMGLFLGFAAARTGSLFSTIVAHAANNALATLLPDVSGDSDAVAWALLAGGTIAALVAIAVLARQEPLGRDDDRVLGAPNG